MTGKRYFKRMWEEEFYIFDSQVISEKEFDEKVEYEDYQAFADSMQGDEVVELLNELNECNNFFIEKTVELIKEYLDVADEQEGILFGNAPVERAYALIELLKELGLNDLLKEKGIELLEDDDND